MDSIRYTDICIIGVPEKKEREKEAENLSEEIIAENFPNLGKETDTQVQEAQRFPNRLNPKRSTSGPIIIKMSKVKDKEKILIAAREKHTREVPYDSSAETLQDRREWHNTFKVMKGKKPPPPRILYLARLSFRFKEEIKNFIYKSKAEGIHHHQTNVIKNIKETSLRGKEKATTKI